MKKVVCLFYVILISSIFMFGSTVVFAESNSDSADLAKLNSQVQQFQKLQKKVKNSSDEELQKMVAKEDVSNSEENKNSGNNSIKNSPNISTKAFSNVLTNRLPFSEHQIKLLHRAFNNSQRAAAAAPGVPAKPTSSAISVNLRPDSTPPVIRLGAGYITSLVFLDSTGMPWPIQAYSVGNPNAYNIQWDRKSNALLVQAETFYKRSNMAVMLVGLSTPIMITLIPGQTAIDYRVDLRIPGFGPNASATHAGVDGVADDPVMLSVLNGVTPKGAKQLTVYGNSSSEAWLLNNRMYVRTNLNIISPGWLDIVTSSDGTHAYELDPASVVLALPKDGGSVLKIRIGGVR